MADSPTTRDPGDALPGANGSGIVPDGRSQLVLPAQAASTDDTPTVISKALPGHNHGIMLAEGLSLRGRSLAHFELLEPIGVGGMAAVLRARDKQLDRFVALKILPPEMAVEPENVRRFHQEARAAAKLDHENIARVFFCGEDQNLHFIAFEFVEGENLRAILEQRGRLPVPEAVRYMLQIATGLEHAASRGVVHRDIKPSNIIITPTGRAKLVDMGLARSLHPHGDQGLTQSGVTLGTFDYISPEQALEPREADARSDIYSLGCTFYHMLTGEAPVPEGTAAKKLHHHQHIAPVDPRQLNPDIPDEVAAVLARMMAKDPKDRYQRPVHLVQHLMQVAQHVGAAAEVPEGVLFVDAPLPNVPRKRPLLMAALATVFLAALLFGLALAPSGTRPIASPQPKTSKRPNEAQPTPPREPATTANTITPTDVVYHVPDELEKVREVLATGDSPKINVIVDGETDLKAGPLVFNGKGRRMLKVTGKDAGKILLRYEPEAGDESTAVGGILVDRGEVTFINVRFEVEAERVPDTPVAAVMLQAGSAWFERCTFSQKGWGEQPLIPLRREQRVPLASVAVQNKAKLPAEKLHVFFKECYFKNGQDAVALDGAAEVTCENCSFGPHNALFHLRGDSKEPEAKIHWNHCSAFVVNGPAFRLDEQARCELTVDNSIISCPQPSLAGDEQALILQTDDAETPHVRYFGKRNRYHGLDLVWGWKADKKDPKIITKTTFNAEVARAGGRDSAEDPSLFLDQSPWASQDPLNEKEPLSMFMVRPALAQLRSKDKITPLGVQRCAWGVIPPLGELREVPVIAQATPGKNEKIVDPEAPDDVRGSAVYKTLFDAVRAAKNDDVILLKHAKYNREILVDSGLNPKAERLTIRPYEGFQPILTLLEADGEPNAAMFKLYDSEIRLENLGILFKQTRYKSQAAVLLFGDGRCDFYRCIVTIAKDTRNTRVVSLGDPEQVMKMQSKTGRQMPEVYFKDCFVRGDGDLLRMEKCRPAKLDMKNSLIALTGSLAAILADSKDPPRDPPAWFRLENVSAFLGGALLRLKGDEARRALVPINLDAGDCVFAALAGKPLVWLDKLNLDDEQLQEYVNWLAGKQRAKNLYTGFRVDKMVDQPESMMFQLRPVDWKAREPNARFREVRFKLPPLSERPLARAVPDDFLPAEAQMDLEGFGARYADLPVPVPVQKPETAAEAP